MLRSEAVIDLAAITPEVAARTAATSAEVRADGYGAGLPPPARAAVASLRVPRRYLDASQGH